MSGDTSASRQEEQQQKEQQQEEALQEVKDQDVAATGDRVQSDDANIPTSEPSASPSCTSNRQAAVVLPEVANTATVSIAAGSSSRQSEIDGAATSSFHDSIARVPGKEKSNSGVLQDQFKEKQKQTGNTTSPDVDTVDTTTAVKEEFIRSHGGGDNEIVSDIMAIPADRPPGGLSRAVRITQSSPGAYALGGPPSRYRMGVSIPHSTASDIESPPPVTAVGDGRPAAFGSNDVESLIEAQLVDEEAAEAAKAVGPIIVAEELVDEHGDSRHRIRIIQGVSGLVIVILLIVIVALLTGGKNDETDNSSSNIEAGDEAGTTSSNNNNNSLAIEEEPQGLYCFQFPAELEVAIDAYYQEDLQATELYGHPIGNWCVSEVSNFRLMFHTKRNPLLFADDEHFLYNATYFHEDIGDWDMSNAENMEEMFRGVKKFSASWGIQKWNTTNVKILKATFMDTGWTGPPVLDLGGWDTSNVELMDQLFRWSNVSTANISNWDTRNVWNIGQLAQQASNFNDDLSRWNVSHMKKMYRAFQGASSFQGDLSNWDVGNLEELSWAFDGASVFNSDISGWQVQKVVKMIETFQGSAFNQDISSWNLASAADLRNVFAGASSFRQDLCAWGSRLSLDANVTGMFVGTACPNTSDPIIPNGPFCFNCNAM